MHFCGICEVLKSLCGSHCGGTQLLYFTERKSHFPTHSAAAGSKFIFLQIRFLQDSVVGARLFDLHLRNKVCDCRISDGKLHWQSAM